MLLDPREIPIVPSPRRLYLRSDKTKVVSTLRGEKSNFVATTQRGQSLTNHYRSALARGRDRALETKPLMISICIRPFGSFLGGEGRGGLRGPRTKSPVNYVRS